MRETNRRYCPATDKLQFPRERLARIALMQAIAKGRKEKRIYRCPFCGDWHLTSRDKK